MSECIRGSYDDVQYKQTYTLFYSTHNFTSLINDAKSQVHWKQYLPCCSKCSKLNGRPARSLNKTNDVLKMLLSTDTSSADFSSSVSTTNQ